MVIITAFSMMGVFFLIGLYVAGALGVLSLVMMQAFSDAPLWNILGNKAWESNTNFILVAVPLFLLMGELMLRSGMGERMYGALSRWLVFLPGGLLHTNIASCGGVCCLFRFQRRNVGNNQPRLAAFVPSAWLQRKAGDWIAGRRRYFGHPDSSQHWIDHLRCVGRGIHWSLVYGRVLARLPAGIHHDVHDGHHLSDFPQHRAHGRGSAPPVSCLVPWCRD